MRHLIGKDIIRFHCVYWPAMLLSAGIDPPPHVHVHGWLLVGGEKMSKTSLNQIAPADLVADFGVDGYRYHFLRDQPFGPDGDFSYEGMVARYNADLANNLGNLLARVATVVGRKCGGIGPAPRPDSPLATVAADVYARPPGVGRRCSPARRWRPRGGSSARPTPSSRPTSRGRPSPGPGVDARAGRRPRGAAARGRAGRAGASPAAAQAVWERIGLAGRVGDQRAARRGDVGRLPRRRCR